MERGVAGREGKQKREKEVGEGRRERKGGEEGKREKLQLRITEKG